MAIPSDPTATTTVTWAMKSAGQYNVSNTQIAEMIAGGLQELKTELWEVSKNDILTATETIVVLATGNSTINLPADFDHELEPRIYWASDDLNGYATAGAAQTITLPTTMSSSDDAYDGLYIFLLGGTGSPDYRQITGYVGSTRVASVTHAWGTTPDATTQILIGQRSYVLSRRDEMVPQHPYSAIVLPYKWLPARYEVMGRTMRVWPAPDRAYAMILKYIPNMTRLDETATSFVRLLRERFDLFVQGIRVKTMKRYDDERYEQELAVWNSMKAQYGAANKQSGRVPFVR